MNCFSLTRGTGRGPKLITGYAAMSEDDTITVPGAKFVHTVMLQTVEDHDANAPLPLVKTVATVGVSYAQVTITNVDIAGSAYVAANIYFILVVS